MRPGTQPQAAQPSRRQPHIVRPDSPVPAGAPAVQRAQQAPMTPMAPRPQQALAAQPSAFAARLNKVVGQPQGFSRWNAGPQHASPQQAGEAVAYGHPPHMVGPGAALDDAAASAPKTKESRKSKRKSTRLPGLIHIGKGRPDVECSVRDISATGALISLAPTGTGRRNIFDKKADVPDRFWLTLKADRMQVDCTVVRRQGEELGVQFLCAPRMV